MPSSSSPPVLGDGVAQHPGRAGGVRQGGGGAQEEGPCAVHGRGTCLTSPNRCTQTRYMSLLNQPPAGRMWPATPQSTRSRSLTLRVHLALHPVQLPLEVTQQCDHLRLLPASSDAFKITGAATQAERIAAKAAIAVRRRWLLSNCPQHTTDALRRMLQLGMWGYSMVPDGRSTSAQHTSLLTWRAAACPRCH
jgi:hypothetical protein